MQRANSQCLDNNYMRKETKMSSKIRIYLTNLLLLFFVLNDFFEGRRSLRPYFLELHVLGLIRLFLRYY